MALRSGSSRSKIVCKSGSEWTHTDLEFFRIKVLQVKNSADFFGLCPSGAIGGNINVLANSDVKEFLGLDLSNVIIQHTFD
jgi:hypothetical protein